MSCSAGCMWNRYVFTEEDTLFGVFVVGVVLGFFIGQCWKLIG